MGNLTIWVPSVQWCQADPPYKVGWEGIKWSIQWLSTCQIWISGNHSGSSRSCQSQLPRYHHLQQAHPHWMLVWMTTSKSAASSSPFPCMMPEETASPSFTPGIQPSLHFWGSGQPLAPLSPCPQAGNYRCPGPSPPDLLSALAPDSESSFGLCWAMQPGFFTLILKVELELEIPMSLQTLSSRNCFSSHLC